MDHVRNFHSKMMESDVIHERDLQLGLKERKED
jgi:hypothetical protein